MNIIVINRGNIVGFCECKATMCIQDIRALLDMRERGYAGEQLKRPSLRSTGFLTMLDTIYPSVALAQEDIKAIYRAMHTICSASSTSGSRSCLADISKITSVHSFRAIFGTYRHCKDWLITLPRCAKRDVFQEYTFEKVICDRIYGSALKPK